MSREIFKCSFNIPFILVSKMSLQKSGSADMSFCNRNDESVIPFLHDLCRDKIDIVILYSYKFSI